MIRLVTIKKVINKRLLGIELTTEDLQKYNSWSFKPFGIDEKTTLNGDKVYTVYKFTGLFFNDKIYFNRYDNILDATKEYFSRILNKIDCIE